MEKKIKLASNGKEVDWEEVEKTVSIICRKFNNINSRYIEDLAQELRIHAFYVSNNYYDLYRKAIDFWRTLTVRVYPEIPTFDMEMNRSAEMVEKASEINYKSLLASVMKELNRPGENLADKKKKDLAIQIMMLIVEDIDENMEVTEDINLDGNEADRKYIGAKLNASWVSERLHVSYKAVMAAMRELEETFVGLAMMGKVVLDDQYRENYRLR